MYIEFSLPQTVVGYSARTLIAQELTLWAARYHIPYKTKTAKNKYRVTFDQPSHYSLFATTWNCEAVPNGWARYRFVEPMSPTAQ
jgi:hypothetical protein